MTISIRDEFAGALDRINGAVEEAIEGLRPYGRAALWGQAVDAALAISRAPKHLVRPQLVLLGHLAGGGAAAGPGIERFTVGVELLHLFMLIHDDAMDHATLRRGRPTVHMALRRADPSLSPSEAHDLAVLVGSSLHVLAMQRLAPGAGASAGEAAACAVVLEASLHAGAGEFQDLLGWREVADSPEAFRQEMLDKGAWHSFVAPLVAGLRLADADADTVPAVEWASRAGIAFQALDDVRDLVSSTAETGKDALRDLLERRQSLPLLLLRHRASDEERAFLQALAHRDGLIHHSDRSRVHALLAGYGIVERALDYALREVALAGQAADGAGWSAQAREGMRAVERLLVRHLEALQGAPSGEPAAAAR